MQLSVITLTLNHPDYVERLSKALQLQELPEGFEWERILVNHGARGRGLIDPVTTLAKSWSWRVVEPGSNRSYSEGNNLAARDFARGEYVLLLNDDAIPEPDFVAQLWARREGVTIQGALMLHADRTVNHAGVQLAPWPAHIGRGEPEARWRGRGLMRSDGVTFAAVMMPRAVMLPPAGALDEGFWYGFEDTDLCCRVMAGGGLIGVNLDAVAIHGELGTRKGGTQDQPNAKRFAERWLPQLPALAREHAQNWSCRG